jgi:hypothetical protein
VRGAAAFLFAMVPALATAQRGATNEYGNPLKLPPRATSPAITQADLQSRLYIFADDSMLGRQSGTIGNKKGTDYIEREVRRLGLEPAGDNGTYFQNLPYGHRNFTRGSELRVGNTVLSIGSDFAVGQARLANQSYANLQVIYGGVEGDTTKQISAAQAVGRFVILTPAAAGARGGAPGAGGRGGAGGGRGGFGGAPSRFLAAAAVATVNLDALEPAQRAALNAPPANASLLYPTPAPQPGQPLGAAPAAPQLRLTTAAAEQLMGVPLANLAPGAAGRVASVNLVLNERLVSEYGRNVVAILRGSDPTLKAEFVAIGAHNDHVGFNNQPVDHDSARAVATMVGRLQMADGKTLLPVTPDMRAKALELAKPMIDSLRKIRPARLDSIRNGADDDGSGSMAVLEIAEAMVTAKEKPKRSIIFVWHTGEEGGLSGSRFFTDFPTVPREQIVTQINVDMIGRGRGDDLPGGSPDYLAVVGSRMLSSELGEMVASSNSKQKKPLKLDYTFDEPTTWPGYNNIYGRSDHANYARFNIPIAFFFTGLHRDYHQVTDEPQYIDYPHYLRITNYIFDLTKDVANSPTRPKVDRGPRM